MKTLNPIAIEVQAIRRAQARAHDAFMALPLTIPASQFQRFADALENLSIMTDIAVLTRLTEEMQDLAPEATVDRPSICAGLQGFMS
jgi:hypothetical protein